MQILLIDNNSKYKDLLLRSLVSHEVTLLSVDELDSKNLPVHDVIILSGGQKFSVMNNPGKYHEEIKMIREVTKPVLGICMGMQIIARAYDGTLQKLSKKIEAMRQIRVRKDDILFEGKKEFLVYERHQWVMADIPPEFDILADSIDGIEIIRHKQKRLYGVQFHPEVRDGDGYLILEKFLDTITV